MTEPQLWGEPASQLLKDRYLADGDDTSEQFLDRAVTLICSAYRDSEIAAAQARKYHAMIRFGRFIPTTTLMLNASRGSRQLGACTVIPLSDNPATVIAEAAAAAIRPLVSGAGVGLDLSVVPPRLLPVGHGASPGPVAVLRGLVGAVAESVSYVGAKRAAMMASLYVSHPDVFEFVAAKRAGGLAAVNTAVATDRLFTDALNRDGYLFAGWRIGDEQRLLTVTDLGEMHRVARRRALPAPDLIVVGAEIESRTAGRVVGAVVGEHVVLRAHAILDAWADATHACGDPGYLDLEAINRADNAGVGPMHTTAPCGEQPLRENENCFLGSVVLPAFVHNGAIEWAELETTVALAVRFLDDAVTAAALEGDEFLDSSQRKIGLGVMGLADVLAQLELPYDDNAARQLAADILERIAATARQTSARLADERGAHDGPAGTHGPMRNATLISIAPTGNISHLAGCTPSIEPYYRLRYRQVVAGRVTEIFNPLFTEKVRAAGYDLKAWIQVTEAEAGYRWDGRTSTLAPHPTGIARCDRRLDDLRAIFATSGDLEPLDEMRMIRTLQNHVDNGISKTVNLPADTSRDEVRELLVKTMRLGLKGIAFYRDGSLLDQPQHALAAPPS